MLFWLGLFQFVESSRTLNPVVSWVTLCLTWPIWKASHTVSISSHNRENKVCLWNFFWFQSFPELWSEQTAWIAVRASHPPRYVHAAPDLEILISMMFVFHLLPRILILTSLAMAVFPVRTFRHAISHLIGKKTLEHQSQCFPFPRCKLYINTIPKTSSTSSVTSSAPSLPPLRREN